MVAAGLGAVAGNVVNPWFRWRGGQGLGITAGVLAAGWPLFFPIGIIEIAVLVATTRSAAIATLGALTTMGAATAAQAFWYPLSTWETALWGVGPPWLWLLVAGLIALIAPKQVVELRRSGATTRR